MSKPKIAPAGKPKQETVRLSDVTIRWKRRQDFGTEAEDVTITGARLGAALVWLSRAKHAALLDYKERLDLTEARLTLRGVAELQQALSETDLSNVDTEPIFHLFSRITEDAMAMLSLAEDEFIPRCKRSPSARRGRPPRGRRGRN